MKKRFVTTLLAIIACIACIIGLAACGADPVDGKTYEFDKVEITAEGLEGEAKEAAEEAMKAELGECYIKFNADGTFEMDFMGGEATGTYKQDGSKLTLTAEGQDQELKVSGDTISIEMEVMNMEIKVIFKAVENTEADAE